MSGFQLTLALCFPLGDFTFAGFDGGRQKFTFECIQVPFVGRGPFTCLSQTRAAIKDIWCAIERQLLLCRFGQLTVEA
jgi:hypothetical protein